MRVTDVFNAKAIALAHTEVASNKIAYLGTGLFPAKKKMGLDLKWIKTGKGLPVSLAPSSFDTNSTIRSREGIKINETEMAFFKESMLLKEQDEQDLLRIADSSDPYAKEVVSRIYDDAEVLVDGANVVPERMIMQLLASNGGHPSISISANGSTYAYNYDPDNSYATNNYLDVSGTSTDAWSDTTNSDPIGDVQTALDAVETLTGSRPEYMIVSRQTMTYLKQNANVRSYILSQNASVIITDARVREIFSNELGVTIIVYTKQFKNESGVATKFYPDGFATLIPSGALGNTWYGCTPEERSAIADPTSDVALVDTGVAIQVSVSKDPVQTKTTVSEIVLPSFERMNETFTIKCY